ncbi:hypothetical protein IFO70_19580 [Phormidium tenue FACHB-886]|nr:hypothetical protein [Phormidium tenue FACHB-886]
MTPHKHSSAEKLTVQRLAGDFSKSIRTLDHRLDLPLTHKRSKAHAEAIQPSESKHAKNKHQSKSKHPKRRKHAKRARLFRTANDAVQYSDFSNVSQLTLNGNSSSTGGVLRLTPAQTNQAGSAFLNTPYSIDGNTSFKTRFQFRLSGGDGTGGANGLVFMLQNSNSGSGALGSLGGGEGYSGIGKSLAIEFDTHKSSWDPNNNHVALLRDGDVTKSLAVASANIDLNGGSALNAWIDYDGLSDQLSVYLSSGSSQPASALFTSKIDLASVVGSKAYVGFSAATGGLTNQQDLRNWEFVASNPAPPPPPPPPSPSAPPPLIPSAGAVSFNYSDFTDKNNLTLNGDIDRIASAVLRLTRAEKSQVSSAFTATPYSIDTNTSFSTRFQFRLSGGDGTKGANGIVFMLQNDERSIGADGTSGALGGAGGAEGYGGYVDLTPGSTTPKTYAIRKSLAIEFDTHKSSWDPNDNHVALLRDGYPNRQIATAPPSIDLNGGSSINAWIDYNGLSDQLNVYLSSSTTKPTTSLLSSQIDLANVVGSRAFVGFSAATGGLTNQQDIENWEFSTSSPTRPPTPTPTPNFNLIQGSDAAETIEGTAGSDEIWGNGGNDSLRGNSGDDLLLGGTGNDLLDGGDGIDTVSYVYLLNSITADLSQGVASRVARIMPLGDSITLGITDNASSDRTSEPTSQPYIYTGKGGYRAVLWSKFQQNNLAVDFVGTQSDGSQVGDKDHEGHGGQTIDWLDQRVNSYLSSTRPDIVLVMAGTNDTYIRNGTVDTAPKMADQLSSLIDKVLTYSPDVKVRVATIAPIPPGGSPNGGEDWTGQAQLGRDFNNLIPGVVASKKSTGRDVEFVDNRAETLGETLGLTATSKDIVIPETSRVHPTDGGYDKIGNLWFNSLSQITTAQGTYKVDQDTLVSIENLIGSVYNDSLSGNSSSNLLTGGYGSDSLRGNGGADTFFYQAASDGTDTIADFDGDDRFQLSASGFGGGLAAGVNLSGSAASTGVLVNGDNAISGDPTFLYSNGSLWFDLDGTGAGNRVEIAKLATRPASLSLSQFSIVA